MARGQRFSITYMSGPKDGSTVTFEQPPPGSQRIVSLGRRDTCDIPIPEDNQVSRLHAQLGCVLRHVTSSDTTVPPLLSFWLEDSGSRNGTFVDKNSEPITRRTALRPGSLFRVGRTWLRLDEPISFEH